ncbi:MAG: hypothetical protein OIN86_07135 [Candidatus Methanoperedens sp.]|nr:hypothetical protein [Candidatus Methanoperedens sp.]
MDKYYDIVIVGAGPAGLFCGHQLCNNTKARILIVDKGRELKERHCAVNQKEKCADCNPCNIISGIGGSGFCLDAKLCLSENVGEILQKHTPDCGFDSNMVRFIDNFLLDDGTIKPIFKKNLKELRKSLQKFGLNLENYPVRSFLQGKEKIEDILSLLLQNSVDVLDQTEATNISKNSMGEFDITIKNNGTYQKVISKFLVIAPGKSGVKWLLEQSNLIGLNKEKNPLYVGIRIEVKNHIVKKLTSISHNPKVVKYGKNSYLKTHCFCEGGNVIKCKYEDIFLVDGHPKFDERLENTNFTIFTKLVPPKDFNSTFVFANKILSNFINRNNKNVLLQRLGDLKRRISTTENVIETNLVKPTLEDYDLRDINKYLPAEVIDPCLSFLEDLNKICPGINDDSTLVYAPVIEWWGDRILANKHMETNIENLYVIGDGSGLTQGIIAASATGLIASNSIINKLPQNQLQLQNQKNLILKAPLNRLH